MLSNYPDVIDERGTLALVKGGWSLARFGDGEWKLCYGRDCVSQPHHPELQRRLCQILSGSQSKLLVGIPNMGKDACPVVMRNHWNKYRRKPEVLQLLNPDIPYASSTITRPDSVPGINTGEYWALFRSVWESRNVVYAHGGKKNIRPQHLMNAESVREVITPNFDAWRNYWEILKSVINECDRDQLVRPIVVMCCGATATVLAADLTARGIQAFDAGHAGRFMRIFDEGKNVNEGKHG